jgi:hypothetical protein
VPVKDIAQSLLKCTLRAPLPGVLSLDVPFCACEGKAKLEVSCCFYLASPTRFEPVLSP